MKRGNQSAVTIIRNVSRLQLVNWCAMAARLQNAAATSTAEYVFFAILLTSYRRRRSASALCLRPNIQQLTSGRSSISVISNSCALSRPQSLGTLMTFSKASYFPCGSSQSFGIASYRDCLFFAASSFQLSCVTCFKVSWCGGKGIVAVYSESVMRPASTCCAESSSQRGCWRRAKLTQERDQPARHSRVRIAARDAPHSGPAETIGSG